MQPVTGRYNTFYIKGLQTKKFEKTDLQVLLYSCYWSIVHRITVADPGFV